MMLCHQSVRRILAGESFTAFRAWMLEMVDPLLAIMEVAPASASEPLRNAMATELAINVWNAVPIPENRFRPRSPVKPERNAPCPCGSGRKYKQCCAALGAPDLGAPEAMLLASVLKTYPRKGLRELPLYDADPRLLAEVALLWESWGQDKDALALLEGLFEYLPKLDRRAEAAADQLLDCYRKAHAPRKRQRFIDALKASADRTLSACAWQRQATIDSDRGDYPAAWRAFREAQRLVPNEPALSHLEILLLLGEGRREEARARAQFWAAKLARDPKYDHSELIGVLRDLVSDSGESMLRLLPMAEGPQAELGRLLERCPPVACAYHLDGAELVPDTALQALEQRWCAQAMGGGLADWLPLLGKEPLALQSFLVLGDLVEELHHEPDVLPGSSEALGRLLLERGERLRNCVLETLQAQETELPWGFHGNRPLLRLTGDYALEMARAQPQKALEVMRWLVLTANPHDNQGMREYLIHDLVRLGQADEAVAVAARYPDDFAFVEYGRVLALFASGRLAEAETALRQAVASFPKVWKALVAARARRPDLSGPGIVVGSDNEGWHYRDEHFELWRDSGALHWAGQLPALRGAPGKRPGK